jgi:hypothetical protein
MISSIRIKTTVFVAVVFFSLQSFGQTIKLKGKVIDSLMQPLAYANVLAEPDDNLEMRFAIVDEKGRYQLNLHANVSYKIRVSFLGYKPTIINFSASKDTIKDFILVQSDEQLNEVEINVKQAITVKKDTIRYRTDYFVTGEERKLRDVLKKLPGVEVDKAGNVMVNGKIVTKVLVEDKQFFTGDSKLAVNNIPADAVDEIEVIDNYNEVTLLKGLESSDELAMNIKLKESKKNFVFGDIEAGGGITDKYLAHPSIFYYSPKRSISIIGDFNNIGKKSFTFKDYLEFEGGYRKILLNPSAYFSFLNDDFSAFLSNQNFKSSTHKFVALNVNQSINDKTELNAYTIYSSSVNQLESQLENIYINDTENTIENRNTKNNPNNRFIISKIGVEYTGKKSSTVKLQSFFKSSKNNSNSAILTNFNTTSNTILTTNKAKNTSFKQNIDWYKRLNNKHTFTFLANYNFTKGDNFTNWQTTGILLQNLIPIIEDTDLSIFKNKETLSSSFSLLFKHYWILGDFVHLYTTIGSQFYFDDYVTSEYQLVSSGIENNFNQAGFGNDVNFKFQDIYAGVHLKFQRGIFTFKPGLFYHQYRRKFTQGGIETILNKPLLLPEANIKADISNNEKLRFRYNLRARFPSVAKLASQFTLINYNSIYQGDNNLGNELSHSLRLYYNKFSLYKKLNYNLTLSYIKKVKSLRNKNRLIGIDFVTNSVILNNADEKLSINGNIGKTFGRFKLSLNSYNSFSENLQVFNEKERKNNSNRYELGTKLSTDFKKMPNIGIAYQKSFTFYKSVSTSTKFINDNLLLNLEYNFLNDFIVTVNYNYSNYNNKGQNINNKFNNLDASFFYQKEDSPWGFELNATNLLNTTFQQQNSFSDFIISDQKTFILPRIIILKISYKL